MTQNPTIHVFVPVHNERKYLEATLNSVEKATNFYEKQGRKIKVSVSDNLSNDGSDQIIKNYRKRNLNWDFRKTQTLLSGNEHFNDLIQSCRTKYICIIGGHDLISENYFHELEFWMDRNKNAVLTFCKEYVDESGNGRDVREVEFNYDFDSDAQLRFWQSILYLGNATCIQGLIYTKHLQSVNAFESQVSDLVWLHGILKHGVFTYNDKASYIRTNPIRPSGFVNPKERKLNSDGKKMEVSLLETWTPEGLSPFKENLAAAIVRMKFSNRKYKVAQFRFLRKLSQAIIPPASGAKVFSLQSTPIQKILSD